jgi:hypothetical protein
MHVRKSIRDAVVTALTGLTTTGSRVFPGRIYPLQEAELPGLTVYTDDEPVRVGGAGPSGHLERDLQVVVEASFKDTASLDDLGDTILEEVETALGAPGLDLGGAKRIRLSGIEFDRDREGDKPAARMRMTLTAPYITAPGAPATAL